MLANFLIDDLIKMALKEDINYEDLATQAIFDNQKVSVALICKQEGIVAGLPVFKRVFELLDNQVTVQFLVDEGDCVKEGQIIAKLYGNVQNILSGERVALNYLQRMSGIATATNHLVKKLKGTKIKLLDTRKTTPNMRIFEKYAVRVGGGYNHRYNLSSGIMLKDNHIAAAGGIKLAVEKVRLCYPFIQKIEVEVENLSMVNEALDAKVDIIMLDNMSIDEMEAAVALINQQALIECSGNIDDTNIQKLKNLAIDYISCGAITHSAGILDFSMKQLLIK